MKMPAVSDEMKRLATMLEDEVRGWPRVRSRPLFGMTGLYREDQIFAALPRTRALGSPQSVIFRFETIPEPLRKRALRDQRIRAERPGAHWYSFEVISPGDLSDVLWWLAQAFDHAVAAKRARKRSARTSK